MVGFAAVVCGLRQLVFSIGCINLLVILDGRVAGAQSILAVGRIL